MGRLRISKAGGFAVEHISAVQLCSSSMRG